MEGTIIPSSSIAGKDYYYYFFKRSELWATAEAKA